MQRKTIYKPKNLTEEIETKGLTQADLTHMLGFPRGKIWHRLNTEYYEKITKELIALADALDTTVSLLLGETEAPKPSTEAINLIVSIGHKNTIDITTGETVDVQVDGRSIFSVLSKEDEFVEVIRHAEFMDVGMDGKYDFSKQHILNEYNPVELEPEDELPV